MNANANTLAAVIAKRSGDALLKLQFASFLLLLGPFVTTFAPELPRTSAVDWLPLGLWVAYVPFAIVLIGFAALRRAAYQDQAGLPTRARIQAIATGSVGGLLLTGAMVVVVSAVGAPGLLGVLLVTAPLWVTGLMMAVAAGRLEQAARPGV